ncbi:hypothetical protein JCM15519_09580 [Fundidesulfovibrio butyratiphilus]
MQILPGLTATSKTPLPDYFSGLQSSQSAGTQFAELFAKRYQSMRQTLATLGVTDTTASDLSQDLTALQSLSASSASSSGTQSSQASKVLSDSVQLDAMQNVKMTQEDFAQLRPKLEQAGIDKETLDDVQTKVSSPEGMTWGQFVYTLREGVTDQVMGKVQLTDQDKQGLTDFFTRLGFDSGQAKSMMESVASGKGSDVWKQVNAKLASLSPDDTLSFSPDELQALSKAMRLTPESQAKLSPLFQAMESQSLTAKDVAEALRLMHGEQSKQLDKVDQVMGGVRQAVGDVLADSADRYGLSRKTVENQLDAKNLATGGNAEKINAAQSANKEADKAGDPGQQGHGNSQNPQNARNDLAGWSGQRGQTGNGSEQQKSAQDKAWSDFWGKMRTEEGGSVGTQSSLDKGSALGGLFGQSQSGVAAGSQTRAGQAATDRAQAQSLLDQVENGVLRNLGQGTKQLSLELSPDNLGKLNVVLTVKGKEVQAVIKAESPEASKLLAENLAQVKESLERQGLTVSKLEVRTGLSQEQNLGQQWSGAEQHNQAQERRDALGRMRVGSALGGVGEILAQDVQSQVRTASSSQSGLDLIA